MDHATPYEALLSNFEKRGPKSYGKSQSSGGNFGKQQRSYSSPAGAGDANRGPKKWDSSAKSSSTTRPPYGQDKPYQKRDSRPSNNSAKNLLRDVLNSEKPSGERSEQPRRDWNQGSKPYQRGPNDRPQNREGGDRPYNRDGGDRPQRPYQDRDNRGGDRPQRPYQDRDNRAAGRPQRPYQDQGNSGGDRPARPYQDRDNRGGDRPQRPYQDRDSRGGDRPQRPYQDRENRNGDRPQRPSRDRESGERPELHEEAERLHKYLARCGVGSRRAAEILISEGRVEVNGELIMEMGHKILPGDEVKLDMNIVRPEKPHYILLNKPKGVITTLSDPQGRRTIVDLLPDLGVMLRPVGRLDKETEGIIICTNDGNLTDRLTHPKFGVEKEYHVIVRGDVSDKAVERLRKGVNILGRYTEPAFVEKTGYEKRSDTSRLVMVIHEGRNRQIRLMCDAVGHPVDALERVRIGPLNGRGLQAGQARKISQTELDQLYAMSGPEVERSYVAKQKEPEYRRNSSYNKDGDQRDERPRRDQDNRGDNRERGSSERGGYGRPQGERPYWERTTSSRTPAEPGRERSGYQGRRDERPGYDRSARPAGDRDRRPGADRGPSGGDRPVRKTYRKD